MKNLFLLSFFLFSISFSYSQKNQTYTDKKGKKHLCGAFDITTLKTDTSFSTWYQKYYESISLKSEEIDWASNLEDVQVEIFLGTWCGDSKYYTPRFIKLWDDLQLPKDHLKLTGLYYLDNKKKVGPNGEEKGKLIHRVPTFIFYRDNKEIGRIVESPVNSMETDLAQIALGYPSKPNYRAANYLMYLIENESIEYVKKYKDALIRNLGRICSASKELNTLGYLYLSAKKLDIATTIFEINTQLYPYKPNVYDSYAEALELSGNKSKALEMKATVLRLEPDFYSE